MLRNLYLQFFHLRYSSLLIDEEAFQPFDVERERSSFSGTHAQSFRKESQLKECGPGVINRIPEAARRFTSVSKSPPEVVRPVAEVTNSDEVVQRASSEDVKTGRIAEDAKGWKGSQKRGNGEEISDSSSEEEDNNGK